MDMFPPHPGEVLRDYLPADMQVTEAAQKLGVSRVTLSRVLNGHAAISAEMALRLEAALGTRASMWVGMQSDYDLWQARQKPQPKVGRLAA
jgi:addiction module HigA family antidote